MERVLFTELAVLLELDALGSVFLVLIGAIVAIFALSARERYIRTHINPPS